MKYIVNPSYDFEEKTDKIFSVLRKLETDNNF